MGHGRLAAVDNAFREIPQTERLLLGLYLGGVAGFVLVGRSLLDTLFPDLAHVAFLPTCILIVGVAGYALAEPAVRALWASGKMRLTALVQALQPLIVGVGGLALADRTDPLTLAVVLLSSAYLLTALLQKAMYTTWMNESMVAASVKAASRWERT